MRLKVRRREGRAIVDNDHVVAVAGGEEVLLVLRRERECRFECSRSDAEARERLARREPQYGGQLTLVAEQQAPSTLSRP